MEKKKTKQNKKKKTVIRYAESGMFDTRGYNVYVFVGIWLFKLGISAFLVSS